MSEAAPSASSDLSRLLETMAAERVDFVVCGGIACIVHGVARVTADVDLCIGMERENLERFLRAANRLGLRPRAPEPLEGLLDEEKRQHWIEKKAARVFTLDAPDSPLQVDVLLQYPIPYDELAADAKRMQIGNAVVLISSKVHLIEAKQHVQPVRKSDLRDIEDLQELMENEQRFQQ